MISTEPNNNNLEKCYERVFTYQELFVALGLMNSLPFDFLMRTKIDSTVVMYEFKESQAPKLDMKRLIPPINPSFTKPTF